jgi:MFS family permease
MPASRARTVALLGSAQTLAWASTYYLPAILAVPMARDLGVSTATVFGAFSMALVVSALVGPRSGAMIDRHGGRPVLAATSLVFAGGLAALGCVQGPVGLFAAWTVLGLGMGSGLYEAAFASLVRLYGRGSRPSITGITLIAGFASTVGWPLSALVEAGYGWRAACFAWAAVHLVLGLPLNLALPRASAVPPEAADPAETMSDAPRPQAAEDDPTDRSTADRGDRAASWLPTALLAFVFAATWFISTSMAAHLPRLMQAAGVEAATAILVGSLIGPAQVAARLLEFGAMQRLHPLWSARVAAAMHPVGAVALLAAGPVAAPVFGVLHGAGNGILTIAKGTLPLALFGPRGFGRRQGVLMVPARVAQAGAPWLFGLAIEAWGVGALWLSAGLALAACVALAGLRAGRPR